MTRSQFVAVLVVVAAVVGLFLGRSGRFDRWGDDGTVDEGANITGGEQAQTGAAAGTGTAVAPSTSAPGPSIDPPPVLESKPELTGLDGWLQAPSGPADEEPTGLASFDGRVRIVQFWTFGCHNCKATLPHLQELYARHHDDDHDSGLEIIGVHAPEFDREADVGNIQAAAIELGVTWPIALDTDKVNFRAWQGARRFWPRTYVLDQDGRVRFDHIGEGRYDELADTVEYLLAHGP